MEILPITRVGVQAGGDARAASLGTAGTDSAPRRLLKAGAGAELGHRAWGASCTPLSKHPGAHPRMEGGLRGR